MRGAQANQAKKQTKKASQLIWKARMAALRKLKILMFVAFCCDKFEDISFKSPN